MSQHSSQAVASDCCAQHSYDNTLGQVLKITFYGQSALTPESFHARSTHSLKARCSWIRTPWSYPSTHPPQPTPPPGPINTSRSPVTDGCRGQQGLAGGRKGGWLRLGRGVGAFGIVVTRPVCLSVCRWMRSMWPATPPTPHPLLSEVRALIAGQEAWMEGLRGHPGPIPKNLRVRLTQHPHAPALEMCSVKP